MSEFPTPPGDPLDDFLDNRVAATVASGLREHLRQKTTLVLRGRRAARRLIFAAATMVAIVGGLLVLSSVDWSEPDDLSLDFRTGTALTKEHPKPAEKSAEPPASAVAAEWQAFDQPKQRAALYRQAGDRYLDEERDPAAALRCYTLALQDASDQDLAVSADDSWLLMALKEARRKEKSDDSHCSKCLCTRNLRGSIYTLRANRPRTPRRVCKRRWLFFFVKRHGANRILGGQVRVSRSGFRIGSAARRSG